VLQRGLPVVLLRVHTYFPIICDPRRRRFDGKAGAFRIGLPLEGAHLGQAGSVFAPHDPAVLRRVVFMQGTRN
jgi:hypothetical protein